MPDIPFTPNPTYVARTGNPSASLVELPRLLLVSSVTGRVFEFTVPGGVPPGTDEPPGSINFGNVLTMCVQPGTVNSSQAGEGLSVTSFLAFYRVESALTDTSQADAVSLVRSLLHEAEISTNGTISTRMVKLRSGIKGAQGEVESLVYGGKIVRADHDVVDRWNGKSANLYSVSIIHSAWSEYAVTSETFKGVSVHGGINYLTERSGSTDGRVELLEFLPRPDSVYAPRYIWAGVKPNLPYDGETIESYLFSQIEVNTTVAKPTSKAVTLSPVVEGTSEYINDAGVMFDFAPINVSNADQFGDLPTEGDRRINIGWKPRFYCNYLGWNSIAGSSAKKMYGKWRILGRIKMPRPRDRKSNPRWGVRARLVYGVGSSDYREIARGPEIYLPDQLYGDGGSIGCYDLGSFDFGTDLYTMLGSWGANLSLIIDATLLGMVGNTDLTSDSGRFYSALTSNWLAFDNFILLPDESSIFIKLPVALRADEKLQLHVDEMGSYRCHVVERESWDTSQPRVVYRVDDVVPGTNGFACPSYDDGHALIVVLDSGAAVTSTASGKIVDVTMAVRPRDYGGEV